MVGNNLFQDYFVAYQEHNLKSDIQTAYCATLVFYLEKITSLFLENKASEELSLMAQILATRYFEFETYVSCNKISPTVLANSQGLKS